MSGHEERLSGGGAGHPASVLAHSRLPVGLGPLQQLSLGRSHVLLLPLPGGQNGGLQGTAVGEGDGPRVLAFVLVDGIQVDRGVLL